MRSKNISPMALGRERGVLREEIGVRAYSMMARENNGHGGLVMRELFSAHAEAVTKARTGSPGWGWACESDACPVGQAHWHAPA